ncbi:PDZ domain-containing protein [Rhodopirellula halodulae]|uniref:PDZ domain-containing protein n=1 Tax=Rhodopirellula halodulae TaxID=2894198 RepID=UPI001E5BE2E4|nr:PDZ domain-containing protein [Rhodopirellula sp. JC737]MCC9658196.1 PDZ domain-containing protein [Rhodopirellula sp. JC737]
MFISVKSITVAGLIALGVSIGRADEPRSESQAATADPTVQSEAPSHSQWKVQFTRVPPLLAMHLPMLAGDRGLVVKEAADENADNSLLQEGDVLLAVDGRPVVAGQGVPPMAQANIVVLRRGQTVTLPVHSLDRQMRQSHGPQPGFAPYPWLQPRFAAPSVTASAYAGGNESVSVSQNGDQILIEMDLPQLHNGPLRYRGTREQIEEEVRNSNLAPAVRRRVMEAIGQ